MCPRVPFGLAQQPRLLLSCVSFVRYTVAAVSAKVSLLDNSQQAAGMAGRLCRHIQGRMLHHHTLLPLADLLYGKMEVLTAAAAAAIYCLCLLLCLTCRPIIAMHTIIANVCRRGPTGRRKELRCVAL